MFSKGSAKSNYTSLDGPASSHRPKANKSSWDWRAPTLMVGGLLIGIIAGFGHVGFYNYMGERIVDTNWPTQQAWILRAGTALAAISKMSFAVATGTAYVQIFWSSLARHSVSLGRLDSMATVLSSVLELGYFGVWSGRWDLYLVAAITWLLSLVSIVTPGTLTVRNGTQTISSQYHAPQLNFSDPGFYTWNQTSETNRLFTQESREVTRIANVAIYGGEVLYPAEWPKQFGIQYNQSFVGPGLFCENATSTQYATFESEYEKFVTSVDNGAWNPATPDNPADPLMPIRNASAVPIWNETINVYELQNKDIKNLFVFRRWNPSNLSNFDPPNTQLIGCSLQNVTLTINFSYPLVQTPTWGLLNRTNPHPLPAGPPTPQNPQNLTQYSDPRSDPQYWAYYAMSAALARVVVGFEQFGGARTSQLYATNVLYANSSIPDFTKAVEDLFTDLTLSLFHSESFLRPISTLPLIPSIRQEVYNYYDFLWYDAILAYTLATAFAAISVNLGFFAMRRTGHAYSNKPSTILRAQRDPALHHLLVADDSLGADPLPHSLQETEVVFVGGRKGATPSPSGLSLQSNTAAAGIALDPVPYSHTFGRPDHVAGGDSAAVTSPPAAHVDTLPLLDNAA